ncbi:CMGC protein kinase [Fusarium austroafricanum]|uniref:CMGC protein kinase n=1 Tax=Fusarium austroafricanum TaxID=2364996 RepID=A0A8H4KN67_9HYPO|nr:CMGC protein kinase [Fusarium austroafricanum]
MPEATTESKTTTVPSGAIGTTDCGDFVDSDDEYEFDELAEDPEKYTYGIYYPTFIGEILANRYRINHKLGHGGFSVVWMAYDMLDNRDVALKIMVPGNSGEREYYIHDDIANAVSDTSRLLLCLDAFHVQGSHGNHRVLVLPLQGPNIRDYVLEKPISARMLAARQLLQGLEALHKGGIVHCDLNSANVMFGLYPLGNHDPTAKYQYTGRPRKMMIPSIRSKPCELVLPMAPQKGLVTDDILIGDFGMAIRSGTPVGQKVQSPAIYCAPERVHGTDPSFASDMWSYMCVFAELYGKYPLFWGAANSTVISFIVDTLGPLPAQWKGSYQAGGSCDPEWYNQNKKPHPHLCLEKKIPSLRPDATTTELQLVLGILRWGFSYLPEHRPTAAQLLNSTIFKELMAIYGL